MRTVLPRILLAFLIAWLPASYAHAAAVASRPAHTATAHCAEHERMHQGDAHHAQSGCHDCAWCYACSALPAADVAAPEPPTGEARIAQIAEPLSSFFPQQPERPPKA